MRVKNLMDMGYRFNDLDSFTADCFAIIQEEIEKQKQLREKHGKFKR